MLTFTWALSDIVKAAHLRPLTKKEIENKNNSSAFWNNIAHNMQDSKQSSDFVSIERTHSLMTSL